VRDRGHACRDDVRDRDDIAHFMARAARHEVRDDAGVGEVGSWRGPYTLK
jgi:hypothetical protein